MKRENLGVMLMGVHDLECHGVTIGCRSVWVMAAYEYTNGLMLPRGS